MGGNYHFSVDKGEEISAKRGRETASTPSTFGVGWGEVRGRKKGRLKEINPRPTLEKRQTVGRGVPQ